MKTRLVAAAKLAFAGVLVTWLVQSGKLDFTALAIYWQRPFVLLLTVSLWAIGFVLVGSLRWYILLRGVGLQPGYIRTVKLQLIGLFFNTAMPGSVGGDLVKGVYVVREQQAGQRGYAMLSILMDRFMGLASLFLIASSAALIWFPVVWARTPLQPLVIAAFAGSIGVVVVLSTVMFPDRVTNFIPRTKNNLPGVGILRRLYQAVTAYKGSPGNLLGALGLSIALQGSVLIFTAYLTAVLTGAIPAPGKFGAVAPLGFMVAALPVAPGGLGVGHVAFERLYSLAGLDQGANVFNTLILGQLALHLLGSIPYVFYRSKLPHLNTLTYPAAAQAQGPDR